MVDLHSSRKAEFAQGPPSATERRECKSRVPLLLRDVHRDADSGQIDHIAAEHTHVPHQPCNHLKLGARGTLLAIGNVSGNGGSSTCYTNTYSNKNERLGPRRRPRSQRHVLA